jgi:hypothetical protein
MGASVLEKKMHYPVITEKQLAARWKISLKTLRRWRSDNEGPTWHKLFQYVRYHEADIHGFERQSAQHWSAILGDGERVPKVVTRPPHGAPPDDASLSVAKSRPCRESVERKKKSSRQDASVSSRPKNLGPLPVQGKAPGG